MLLTIKELVNAQQIRQRCRNYWRRLFIGLVQRRFFERPDYDDHAEPVWLLEQVKEIDAAFITGTLTEGSNHVPAFEPWVVRRAAEPVPY